jgi:hypothetical protein
MIHGIKYGVFKLSIEYIFDPSGKEVQAVLRLIVRDLY